VNSNGHDRKLVVLQLGGGNDYVNTIVPYSNGLYYDYRPTVHIKPEEVLKIDDQVGFRSHMEPFKRLWDEGSLAIINGIGYPNPNRSHFRSMDIWHTALPEELGSEGWLGRTIRELDPKGENVVTGINFGRGLPRALACRGVPVASVGDLETYGLYPDMQDEYLKEFALKSFARMYGGAQGGGQVREFIRQTGAAALEGANILREAPAKYSSSVEYAATPTGQSLKGVAQVMFADLGTRIFYAQSGGWDTHSGELFKHAELWTETANAVGDFWDDVLEHGYEDDTILFVFSEFGRRMRDNGSGTDHGSGGVAFVIGGAVKGDAYGEYPSLKGEDQLEGDLHFNNDFRETYTTLLEDWLGLDAAPIVNGRFEPLGLFAA
jgi:uncharacterized protein (DUF1501 family)